MKNYFRAFSLICALSAACFFSSASYAQAQFNAFKDPVTNNTSGSVSGPDLAAVEADVKGGAISVGATAYVVAVFKNPGTAPVQITGVNLYPSSTVGSGIATNKCSEAPLPPGGQCAVTVAVTGLQIGAWRVEVLVDHDGRTRLATAALSGDVQGTSASDNETIVQDVDPDPDMLDFGSVTSNIPLVRSIVFRNRTSETVDITSIKLDAAHQSGFSTTSECPDKLQAGESCVVNVRWTPIGRGASEAVLMVNHTARSKLTKVELRGSFAPATVPNASLYPDTASDMGVLVANAEEINFGSGVTGVSSMTMTFVNSGVSDVAIKGIRFAGSESGLSFSKDGCYVGQVLSPVDACTLTVTWAPNRVGSIIDDLQIVHSGARGVLVLPIRGEADAVAQRDVSVLARQAASYASSAMAMPFLNPSVTVPVQKNGIDVKTEGKLTPPDLSAVANVLSTVAPETLDGYTVTSHSMNKVVINGPAGSQVVRDGEDVMAAGVYWTASIVPNGVLMSSGGSEVLLVFDKSFRPGQIVTFPSADSISSSSSSSDTPSSSTSGASGTN